MVTIADDGELDLHAVRHGLKLRRDTGSTMLFDNRNGFDCPVCDRPFATLFVSEERHNRFDPDQTQPFCVVREADRILVLTHS